jgi:hypothetical protein
MKSDIAKMKEVGRELREMYYIKLMGILGQFLFIRTKNLE